MILYTGITFEFLYHITDLYIGCRSLDRVHFYSHCGTLSLFRLQWLIWYPVVKLFESFCCANWHLKGCHTNDPLTHTFYGCQTFATLIRSELAPPTGAKVRRQRVSREIWRLIGCNIWHPIRRQIFLDTLCLLTLAPVGGANSLLIRVPNIWHP